MKAVVNDKKHLTLVSHTNGVVINVVRKFNYDNFNITCKDQLTANSINTLLNCSNSSVDDIVETFKNEIAYSNIH